MNIFSAISGEKELAGFLSEKTRNKEDSASNPETTPNQAMETDAGEMAKGAQAKGKDLTKVRKHINILINLKSVVIE